MLTFRPVQPWTSKIHYLTIAVGVVAFALGLEHDDTDFLAGSACAMVFGLVALWQAQQAPTLEIGRDVLRIGGREVPLRSVALLPLRTRWSYFREVPELVLLIAAPSGEPQPLCLSGDVYPQLEEIRHLLSNPAYRAQVLPDAPANN